MDITDFYTIETPPPSSSTSKDSIDESLLSFQSKKKFKLSTTNIRQESNNTIICSTSKSPLKTNSITTKNAEVIIVFLVLSSLNNIYSNLKIEHTCK
jgi:hypothetical protein